MADVAWASTTTNDYVVLPDSMDVRMLCQCSQLCRIVGCCHEQSDRKEREWMQADEALMAFFSVKAIS